MSSAGSGQDAARFDPFEFWRRYYEANEENWTKTIKEVAASRDYAEAQGKVLENLLAFQKGMRDRMTDQMANMNMPTRDDVSRLGELILGVEEKVDQLHDRLLAIETRLAAFEKSE